ncbi:MAG: methylmalonyl Co-A mutase-associated GTPase MeaB [Myxococcota bacterium]|nr:methylmalonyl Co-A mutase-associated GTPase MeaB [Myxococcota bacterium]
MSPPQPARVADLLEGLAAGDRGAISEALNLVDDRRAEQREAALELLDGLATRPSDHAPYRVGITGAPGTGKSSLLSALVENLRGDSPGIGIIAVDPSSQRTGGALLGDRMRLSGEARESGVFLRSMAARDRLGGLADATQAGAAVLSAVFEWVFIETVGIGQSECEVAQLVDTLVFVAQPGAGDTLQFMKAGILELPDIFVVNKSDTGASAERTRSELAATLGLAAGSSEGDWTPPVLLASARDRQGIDALVKEIHAHREYGERSGRLAERRRNGEVRFAVESLARRYGEYGLERIGGAGAVSERLATLGDRSVFAAVLELGREIEAALGPG